MSLINKYSDYKGRLARFLNEYMKDNKNPGEDFLNEKKHLFSRTVDVVYSKLFQGKIPSKLGITVLESVLIGISSNIDFLESQTNIQIQTMFDNLTKHEEFTEQRLSEGLARKDRVIGRISAARKILSGI